MRIGRVSQLFRCRGRTKVICLRPGGRGSRVHSALGLSRTSVLHLRVGRYGRTGPSVAFDCATDDRRCNCGAKGQLFVPAGVFGGKFDMPHTVGQGCPVRVGCKCSSASDVYVGLPSKCVIRKLPGPVSLGDGFKGFRSDVCAGSGGVCVIRRLFVHGKMCGPNRCATFLSFHGRITRRCGKGVVLGGRWSSCLRGVGCLYGFGGMHGGR